MADDKKIGIGIVGTAAIANAHAAACNANPQIEIVGLAETRQGAAERFSERHNIEAQIFSDYRDLLAMDGLDALIICTPNDVHAPIAIATAEAGKHVLCEKPMATSIEDAKAMVNAAEKAGVRGMMGYTKRFFRGTRFLYDYLRDADLGQIYHVRAIYLQSWLSDHNAPAPWRLEKKITGTGCLGDLGSHITDLAQFLMGENITRVNGLLSTFVNERPSISDANRKQVVDVDDACMYGAEFANGAMGVFEASRNATGHPDHWRIEFDAEKGAVFYDSIEGRVMKSEQTGMPGRPPEWNELEIPEKYGRPGAEFFNEVSHFADCIRSGSESIASFAEGYRTERVLDAVLRSSETGTAVDVDV